MKNFKIPHLLSFLLFFVLLATTLSSCKSTSVVPPATTETTKTVTTKEVIRDTIFETQKDSSYYKAYIDCVNGKVVIKGKIQNSKGNYLKPPKVDIQDNTLTVNCEAEAQKLFAQWKDTYTKENAQTIKKIPYPVEKPLTWRQKTQMLLGGIFLALIMIFIALGILKYFKKI